MIQAILLVALATTNPVEQKLTCVEDLDGGPEPTGKLLLMWSRMRVLRLESFLVHSDGLVLMRVQLRHDRGIRSCRAKLTRERLENFTAELEHSGVCSLRVSKRSLDESDGIFLDLGPKRRCQLELSPTAWAKKPPTRSVQLAIDRLRSELCGGTCADPKPPTERFQLVDDPSRVSPEFRHLYKKPAENARPDAAPPKKP